MNDLIRPALYDAHHDIVSVRGTAPGAAREVYDVVGPVCETSDLFAAARTLPRLKSGDLVAILSAGAYGAVMSSAYNARPPAPEVLVKGDRWSIVRPRPSYEALIAARTPPRLAPSNRVERSDQARARHTVVGTRVERHLARKRNRSRVRSRSLVRPIRHYPRLAARIAAGVRPVRAGACALRRVLTFHLSALERRRAPPRTRQRAHPSPRQRKQGYAWRRTRRSLRRGIVGSPSCAAYSAPSAR